MPIAACAGRAISTAPVDVSSDGSGWQMSIEILGPEGSETTITPIDGRLATIMTKAIAAASCRIEARSIVSELAISAPAARTVDVGDYRVRAHIERVVLANLMAVGTEQECLDGMGNRSIALARPPQVE